MVPLARRKSTASIHHQVALAYPAQKVNIILAPCKPVHPTRDVMRVCATPPGCALTTRNGRAEQLRATGRDVARMRR
jgi:hypothetical protein